MKLPSKWLQCAWVESFGSSTTPQGQEGAGNKVYNTHVIDKSDLFVWIRAHHFPQVTSQEFRRALRGLCRDQRPGYRPSPLNPELRMLLKGRMATLGKRLWGCQENLPELPAQVPATQVASTSREQEIGAASQSQTQILLAQQSHNLEIAAQCAKEKADIAARVAKETADLIQVPEAPDSPEDDSIPIKFQPQQLLQNDDQSSVMTAPDFVVGEIPADFNVDFARVFGPPQGMDTQENWPNGAPLYRQAFTASDMMESLLPHQMTEAHLSVYHRCVELLGDQQMIDVAEQHFPELERSFTQCFSSPSAVSFLIQETNRFVTGRPDPYANQQAKDLFAVDLTQVQHIITGLKTTTQIVENLALAHASDVNTTMVYTPEVWINTRDCNGNPCPRLVDVWMPRITFNGNMHIVVMAPRGAVRLERALTFHVPTQLPFTGRFNDERITKKRSHSQ
jgi:hypothetical protein